DGEGLSWSLARSSVRGSGDVDPRLPIQPPDPQGSVRHSGLRVDESELMEAYSSVRDAIVPRTETNQRSDIDNTPTVDGGGLRVDDDSGSANGTGRSVDVLPSFGPSQSSKFPYVPDRRGEETGEGAPENPGEGVRNKPTLLADRLNEAAELALEKQI